VTEHTVYVPVSETGFCGFESRLRHQAVGRIAGSSPVFELRRLRFVVAQLVERPTNNL